MNANLMNRSQAADYLGISLQMLRKLSLTSSNDGPPLVRIGYRTIRYQRQQLDEWLRQRGAEPALFKFEASK